MRQFYENACRARYHTGMGEPHRRPFWKRRRWIAAAALWLLVCYVLSYGPVSWLMWYGLHPWLETCIGIIYWPLDMLVMHGPERLSKTLLWYVDLWMIDGRSSAT